MNYGEKLKRLFVENDSNVGIICRSCYDKRLDFYQTTNPNKIYYAGDMVKITIGDEKFIEHPWAKVIQHENGKLKVRINNIPVHPDYHESQVLLVELDSISLCLSISQSQEDHDRIIYEYFTFEHCGHEE